MQKVLDFLEKNVQWIALGIGALYLGLMAYGYLAQPAVEVKYGSESVAPGDIDPKIAKDSVKRLKDAMASAGAIQPQKFEPAADLKVVFEGNKPELPSPAPFKPPTPPVGPTTGNIVIAQAVVPPPVTPVESTMDRVTVSYPNPNAAAPDPRKPQPVQPVADLVTQDVDVTHHVFHFDMAALEKAIADAKVPAEAARTEILHVDLVRQEKDSTGNWGSETIVPPLPTHNMPPLPADTASINDQFNYTTWAAKPETVAEMLQPIFLDVVQLPTEPRPVPAVAPAEAPPVPPAARPPVRPVVPARPGAPRDPHFGGDPRMDPRLRPGGAAPAPPLDPRMDPRLDPRNALHRGGGGAVVPGDPRLNPGTYGGAPSVIPGVAAAPGTLPVPNGGGGELDNKFEPHVAADFDIVAHDITAQAGRTYRYALRYSILNPVWRLQGPNIPKNLFEKFALTSADSAWTKEITIPARIKFWLVKANPPTATRAGTAEFDVFFWDKNWQSKRVTAGPGDPIGDSAWTVVDVRNDVKNKREFPYVLITDQNARTVRRDPKTDLNDSEYQQMRDQASTAMAP
jgi:hypothetical protein